METQVSDRDGKRTLAAIDVGTVSTRLIVARLDASGAAQTIERRSTITNLGHGVDATGKLDAASIERTLSCVRDYGRLLAQLAQEQVDAVPEAITITLTSAARDAANAEDLLGGLRALSLDPQIIEGEVEARLSLLGVTGDFIGTPILMADSGGGSTELALGKRDAATGTLICGRAHSFNVGCRRVTERFFGDDPASVPTAAQVASARAFVRSELGEFFVQGGTDNFVPRELVCVGGTATSLVSVAHKLVTYDSLFVHLHRMPHAQLSELADQLLSMSTEERRTLPGLQPKRADVIAAGALILDELLSVGGFDSYIASERDSLFGLLACAYASATHRMGPLAPLWEARTTDAHTFAQSCAGAASTDGATQA